MNLITTYTSAAPTQYAMFERNCNLQWYYSYAYLADLPLLEIFTSGVLCRASGAGVPSSSSAGGGDRGGGGQGGGHSVCFAGACAEIVRGGRVELPDDISVEGVV